MPDERGSRPPVLVATRSVHKLEEIRDILAPVPACFLSLTDLGLDPRDEETALEPFRTFAANALSKARYFHGRSGVLTLADDSGLCVDALGGGPGVRTRRFASDDLAERYGRDEANNRHLMATLSGVPEEERGAHYRCAIAVAYDRGHDVFEGRVDGRIGLSPTGEGGFGYDPLFVQPERGLSFAQLPPEFKRVHSHRAVALRAAIPWLEAYLAGDI